MNSKLEQVIAASLARAPDWLKQQLASREPKVRREAEESVATMIAAAIASSNDN